MYNCAEKLRAYIKERPLLFDGGMGTYYATRSARSSNGCELANLEEPELIREIHREYIRAGARAIKTNTFAANRVVLPDENQLEEVLTAGWKNAVAAAAAEQENPDAFVFADLGPVSGLSEEETCEEYRFLIDHFLKLGADCFLFETNQNLVGLLESARYIRERKPEAFLIASFAILPDGYSREGILGSELVQSVWESGLFDSAGFNCVCGASHMLQLARGLDLKGVSLSLMPNAGYPTVVHNRTIYHSDPNFFASQVAQMVRRQGACIVGGCCGTEPAHIEAVNKALHGLASVNEPSGEGEESNLAETRTADSYIKEASRSDFWDKLDRGEKVFAVELDPPAGIDIRRYMEGARELKEAGADIMNIADSPVARARMDSCLLACKVKRETGLETLPHMTCRDRNLIATKALLFGLYAEGVRNVLLITGDPVPTAERDEVKAVYNLNSRKMASFVNSLSRTELPEPLRILGALNINARNFDLELARAEEKMACGMQGFLTQPVMSPQSMENLKKAGKVLGAAGAKLLCGIIPIISERNARFMDNEINGISVPEDIALRYRGLDREAAEDLSVELCTDLMKEAADHVDGFYLITPFQRTGLIRRIMEQTQDLR